MHERRLYLGVILVLLPMNAARGEVPTGNDPIAGRQ